MIILSQNGKTIINTDQVVNICITNPVPEKFCIVCFANDTPITLGVFRTEERAIAELRNIFEAIASTEIWYIVEDDCYDED